MTEEQSKIEHPTTSDAVPVVEDKAVSSSDSQVNEEAKVEVKEEVKGAKEEVKDKSSSILSKFMGDTDPISIPEDYDIRFPDGMPEEQIKATKAMFVENGLSKEDSQLLTDSIVKTFEQHQQQQREIHEQQYEADIKKLKAEWGAKYNDLHANATRFVKESALPEDILEAFTTHVGAYNAGKLFEKLSRSTRDANYSPPPPSERGSKASGSDPDSYEDGFFDKYVSGDREAFNLIDKRAKQKLASQDAKI